MRGHKLTTLMFGKQGVGVQDLCVIPPFGLHAWVEGGAGTSSIFRHNVMLVGSGPFTYGLDVIDLLFRRGRGAG